ncbi:MAG: 30S ribosomal protein S9 [bacterium]
MITKKTQTIENLDMNKAGRYVYGLGRRKTAIATVRLYFDCAKELKGTTVVNQKPISEYFSVSEFLSNIGKPFEIVGMNKGDMFISIQVKGGGKGAQSEAARLAIARALVDKNENLKPVLRASDLLTRDPRIRERKKPGLKRARKASQWVKR